MSIGCLWETPSIWRFYRSRQNWGSFWEQALCMCLESEDLELHEWIKSNRTRCTFIFIWESLLWGAAHTCDTTLYVTPSLHLHKLHFTCVHILYFTSAAFVALPRNIAEWCSQWGAINWRFAPLPPSHPPSPLSPCAHICLNDAFVLLHTKQAVTFHPVIIAASHKGVSHSTPFYAAIMF